MTHKLTTFNDLKVGQKASLTKTITEEDLEHFIAITGDTNPLHVDDSFAKQTFFGQRIAHGMLSASLFSTLVGMHIPGIGAIYKKQTLEFLRPVFIGDTLRAWFEIMEIYRDKEEILIKSWIENQNAEIVVQGGSGDWIVERFKMIIPCVNLCVDLCEKRLGVVTNYFKDHSVYAGNRLQTR